jgi:hypothetical protein
MRRSEILMNVDEFSKEEILGKINYTPKDVNVHLLLFLGEICFLSATGELVEKSSKTKKFDNIIPIVQELGIKSHKLGVFLDEQLLKSSLPEFEIKQIKKTCFQLTRIVEKLDKKEVMAIIDKLYTSIN